MIESQRNLTRRKQKMKKAEIVNAIAEKTGLTKKDSENALDATFAAITEGLASGGKVQLVGFGTFEVRDRAARIGKNPKTGEPINIPASKNPAFKAGKVLKEAVCG
jgi:DNA-binding protein HU-beta